MKKILLGIFVSVLFVYLSVRGLDLERVLEGLKNVRYAYLPPAVLMILSLSVLRSIRWGLILSPIQNMGQKRLFPITCVGFMAIVLLPMRMGEIVRPYLLTANAPPHDRQAGTFNSHVVNRIMI